MDWIGLDQGGWGGVGWGRVCQSEQEGYTSAPLAWEKGRITLTLCS